MKKLIPVVILVGIIVCFMACEKQDIEIEIVDRSSLSSLNKIIINGDTITFGSIQMKVGATATIDMRDGKKHQWQSQNPEVAAIENDSIVKAIAVGTTKIIDNFDDNYYFSVSVTE